MSAAAEHKILNLYSASNRNVFEKNLSASFATSEIESLDMGPLPGNISAFKLLHLPDAGRYTAVLHCLRTLGLPKDVHQVDVPTACLSIDSFGWTASRAEWIMLFDCVFATHPRFARAFREAGHPNVVLLPYAAPRSYFSPVASTRSFDVGFVGGGFGNSPYSSYYEKRNRVITSLERRFRMNDFRRSHTDEEMRDVYRASKIVVNASRGDYPQEANMRCYEALAAGALLLTGLPSELEELGFREGEHFIGWRSEEEVPDLVSRWLANDSQRRGIAEAGQRLVLKEHTYQKRASTVRQALQESRGLFQAPARSWPKDRVRRLYIDYYYKHLLVSSLLCEWAEMAKEAGVVASNPCLIKAMKALAIHTKNRLAASHR